MKITTSCYTVPLNDAERVLVSYLASLGGQSPDYQSIHRATIRRFLSDNKCSEESQDNLIIDEQRLLQWMVRYVKGRSIPNAWQRLAILNSYLGALVQAGLLPTNLAADFKASHGDRSWKPLIPALQSADPEVALAALRSKPSLPGPLHAFARSYLELHGSLGKKFEPQKSILNRFDRFLQERKINSVTAITDSSLSEWMNTLSCNPTTRIRYAHMLHRFFEHLMQQKAVTNNPVPVLSGERRVTNWTFRPFIFTEEQITAILAEARQLPKTCYSPYKGLTCYTMLVLLYTLGLRHGEARRLRVRDLDDARQTLFIDQTKFHKSRYVPFGPKVQDRLQRFMEVRRTFLRPLQPNDALFVTLWRRPFDHHFLLDAFHRVLQQLGISGIAGQHGPRLHDLRHTFAVHRLLRWYRAGADVQSRLPILATFLGHISPQSTEIYLTITADLLQEANTRFYRNFGCRFDEEARQ